MKELLWSISEGNKAHSDIFEDLAMVLKRAISVASLEAHKCQFCLKADEILR